MIRCQPVGVVVIDTGGLGFDSRAGQMGRSVVNGLSQSRRFFGALLSRRYTAEMGFTTRCVLRRSTAGVIKFDFFLKINKICYSMRMICPKENSIGISYCAFEYKNVKMTAQRWTYTIFNR